MQLKLFTTSREGKPCEDQPSMYLSEDNAKKVIDVDQIFRLGHRKLGNFFLMVVFV